MTQAPLGASPAARTGTLYDTLELIMDKGLVIDIIIRVSVCGMEVLKVEVRIVIASVDTYLRFAARISQIELAEKQALDALARGAGSRGPLLIEPSPAELTDTPSRTRERTQSKP